MNKIYASLLTLLSLVVAILIAPHFAHNDSVIPPSTILSFSLSTFVFLLCLISLISLFLTAIKSNLLRISINFIFSIIVLVFLLPLAFQNVNMGIFRLNHESIGYTGSGFIKSSVVCGAPLNAVNGFISSGNHTYKSSSTTPTIEMKSIEVLCPIAGSPKTFLYRTDHVLAPIVTP